MRTMEIPNIIGPHKFDKAEIAPLSHWIFRRKRERSGAKAVRLLTRQITKSGVEWTWSKKRR